MSIVKDLLLISLFLIAFVQYIIIYKKFYEQKKYFVNILSHDLRISTIAQIRGLEFLEKIQGESELISEIKNSCNFTLDMINTLLNTYRYESKEEFLNYETFNFSDTLNSACSTLSNYSKDKDIEIVLKRNSKTLIQADKNCMHKLITTLVSTAIDYAQKTSSLYIIEKNLTNKIEISIIYQGKSLSEEEKRRMLSKNPRFSTVGHGIKMQLCKKIVDFHKGKIYVKSFGENLNSFTFSLPKICQKKEAKTQFLPLLQA